MYNELTELLSKDTKILYNEPMKNHTTFRIGGNADIFLIPSRIDDIGKIMAFSKEHDIPIFVIGNGSNLLVNDNGIRGIVIKISGFLNEILMESDGITAGAGISIGELARIAQENGFSGMEWSYGIPGTLGGAVTMNAGAFGGEMSNIIKSVEYVDTNGNICKADNEEMKFSYRRSIFNSGECIGIITRCKINLIKSDKEEILNKMSDYLKSRKEKQPLEFPSAGSVFKRPEGYFTGKLISDLGLKGFSIGGAQVSEKHAGFIINKSNATARDVSELIEYIKAKVKETYNVALETEIKML